MRTPQIWFTSDTHFFHRNIIKYCPATRGQFSDEFQMTGFMVEAWNSRVKEDDIVYHLGDVGFGKTEYLVEVIKLLNGKKILVKGNHDERSLKSKSFIDAWEKIYEDTHEIEIDGISITLCHYPLIEWSDMQNGAYHLYGHVHGKRISIERDRMMDVGVDTRNDLAPWSWGEINENLKLR
jgi:calcineurin-like phosphoesterase family protein